MAHQFGFQCNTGTKKSIPYIREPTKNVVTNFSVMIQIINNVIVRLSDKVWWLSKIDITLTIRATIKFTVPGKIDFFIDDLTCQVVAFVSFDICSNPNHHPWSDCFHKTRTTKTKDYTFLCILLCGYLRRR